jgi:hypothetical protein
VETTKQLPAPSWRADAKEETQSSASAAAENEIRLEHVIFQSLVVGGALVYGCCRAQARLFNGLIYSPFVGMLEGSGAKGIIFCKFIYT